MLWCCAAVWAGAPDLGITVPYGGTGSAGRFAVQVVRRVDEDTAELRVGALLRSLDVGAEAVVDDHVVTLHALTDTGAALSVDRLEQESALLAEVPLDVGPTPLEGLEIVRVERRFRAGDDADRTHFVALTEGARWPTGDLEVTLDHEAVEVRRRVAVPVAPEGGRSRGRRPDGLPDHGFLLSGPVDLLGHGLRLTADGAGVEVDGGLVPSGASLTVDDLVVTDFAPGRKGHWVHAHRWDRGEVEARVPLGDALALDVRVGERTLALWQRRDLVELRYRDSLGTLVDGSIRIEGRVFRQDAERAWLQVWDRARSPVGLAVFPPRADADLDGKALGGGGSARSRSATYEGAYVFHSSELDVKRRPPVTWPEGAPRIAVRCRVDVRIDPAGVPTDAAAANCSEPFRGASEAQVMGWRWHPPKVGAEPVVAHTVVAVVFEP